MAGMMTPRDIRAPRGVADHDLYGWVIDNDDSKAKDGIKQCRLKVRIPQLHRGIPDQDLPWCMSMNESTPHAGVGVGAIDIHAIGSKIMVKMDKNDPHVLRYGGGMPTQDLVKDNELLKHDDHPWVSGHIDEGGNKLEINNKEGKTSYTYTHVSGTQYQIDKDGNFNVYSSAKVTIGSSKDIEIVSEANIKLHAKGTLSLKGKPITQNGGDGAASVTKVAARKRPKIDQKQNRVDL